MSEPSVTLTALRRDALELPSLEVEAIGATGARVVVRLGLEPVVIGSAPECHLSLDDPRLSRRHCELRLDQRGIVLRDLGSKNGTLVRELPIVEVLLPLGVPVTVGSSRLSVRIAGVASVVPLSLGARFGEALGGSLPMRALFARLERAAQSDETVLLAGESGTGKELLARGLHEASTRRDEPFEIFDCSAVTPSLLEAELFGYARGAFTGAAQARAGVLARAGRGTLFIDEIGELPLELQPKLLRALEARRYLPLGESEWRELGARIVCATHRDLRERVAAGAFREDLYYRIAVVPLRVPPLRERRDDLPLLVERFLAAQQPPRSLDDLPPHALRMLLAHDWPGNVRELHNTLARLLLFAEIDIDAPAPAPAGTALARLPWREARALAQEQFEHSYLVAKLREHAGNVARTATAMGISRQLLHRLIERYGIERE